MPQTVWVPRSGIISTLAFSRVAWPPCLRQKANHHQYPTTLSATASAMCRGNPHLAIQRSTRIHRSRYRPRSAPLEIQAKCMQMCTLCRLRASRSSLRTARHCRKRSCQHTRARAERRLAHHASTWAGNSLGGGGKTILEIRLRPVAYVVHTHILFKNSSVLTEIKKYSDIGRGRGKVTPLPSSPFPPPPLLCPLLPSSGFPFHGSGCLFSGGLD